jgi:hypothetical protein
MILLLLPAMTRSTSILESTPIVIGEQGFLVVPVRALIFRIIKMMRFTPEVLPIVSIDALFSAMVFVAGRAPHCFEMEHIEISVSLQLIN